MSQTVVFLLAGLVAGVLSGMFGIGGGIILVPVLVYFIGLDQHAASGTSLVALLLPVGILGVLQYYRAGKINMDHIRMGLIVAVGLFFGVYCGSRFSVHLPADTLRKGFSIVLVLAALKMWFM